MDAGFRRVVPYNVNQPLYRSEGVIQSFSDMLIDESEWSLSCFALIPEEVFWICCRGKVWWAQGQYEAVLPKVLKVTNIRFFGGHLFLGITTMLPRNL
jgi:hypothetical protein